MFVNASCLTIYFSKHLGSWDLFDLCALEVTVSIAKNPPFLFVQLCDPMLRAYGAMLPPQSTAASMEVKRPPIQLPWGPLFPSCLPPQGTSFPSLRRDWSLGARQGQIL